MRWIVIAFLTLLFCSCTPEDAPPGPEMTWPAQPERKAAPPMYLPADEPAPTTGVPDILTEAMQEGLGPALRRHSSATGVEIDLVCPERQIIGELAAMQVTVDKGEAADIKWSCAPNVAGFRVNPLDPRFADLTSSKPGRYTIAVSVSGTDGSTDHVIRQCVLHYPTIPQTTPPPSLAQIIGGYAAQVQTEDRADEALVLSAIFRARAAEVSQGSPAATVLARLYDKAQQSLGPSYANWEPFLTNLVSLMEGYQAQGHLRTSTEIGTVLQTAAVVLSGG